MTEFLTLLFSPLMTGVLLAFLGHHRFAPHLNVAGSLITLLAAIGVADLVFSQGAQLFVSDQFYIDALSLFFVAITTIIGATTALFSTRYIRVEVSKGHLNPTRLRIYHSLFQFFIATLLIALTSNNMGILWVAMEASMLATVLVIALYRTPEGLFAAWKYFILCGVGIAQALLGTILIYFAAEPILGHSQNALLWTHLQSIKAVLDPAVLSIAFVFLLIGYGTKLGLVPLHNWLSDAHAEGPTPVSAVLSGLLLNVALFAILRSKALTDVALGSAFSSRLLMGFGLLTLLVAAFSLKQEKDAKRLFGISSIEHMGIISFAFGLNTPLASFAAFLHVFFHSFTKSAIFFAVGHACQMAGTQTMIDIRGLLRRAPLLGWGLLVGVLALLGLPPFGIFSSEFLLFKAAFQEAAWTILPLALALLVTFSILFWRVQEMVLGTPSVALLPEKPQMLPILLHLGLVLVLGIWMPPFVSDWISAMVQMIGG